MTDAEVDASARDYYAAIADDKPIIDEEEVLARQLDRVVRGALDVALDCHRRLDAAAQLADGDTRPYGALLSFHPDAEAPFRAWAKDNGLAVVESISNHDNGTIRTLTIAVGERRSRNRLAWVQWPLEPKAAF